MECFEYCEHFVDWRTNGRVGEGRRWPSWRPRSGRAAAACGGLETCPLHVNLLTCEGGEEVAIMAASLRDGRAADLWCVAGWKRVRYATCKSVNV